LADYSTYSDEQLLNAFKKDDQIAFEQLYHRYWEKLLTIGYIHSKRKEIAEEIVHDVFISLWNRRKTLDINNIEAYLATAVKFEVFTFLRKELRREILIEGLKIDPETDDRSSIEARFLKEYLDKKLARLPQKCRLVFTFSRVHEMSNAQIAGQLNVSQKAVEAHITKALRYLRASVLHSLFIILSNLV
jgi:RNA polymerase sigma-70 factor (family 1)